MLHDAVRFGLADEGEAGRHAPGSDLGLEVVGHEEAAMVMAELNAAGGNATEVAELLANGHAQGLKCLAYCAALAHMPTEALGVSALHRGEEPDLAVPHRRNLDAVGGPHHVWRVGHVLAVVVVFWAWPGPVRQAQGVPGHQPQHAPSRNAHPPLGLPFVNMT